MAATSEPKTLQEAIVFFADPVNCRKYVIPRRWPKGVTCPRCGSKDVLFLEGYNRWHCRAKHDAPQFTLKTGTVMEDSPLGLDKWLTAIWQTVNCRNGISSYEVHRVLGITQKTAWFLDHRIRLALTGGAFNELPGEIEARETLVLGNTKKKTVQDVQQHVRPGTPKEKLLKRIIALRDSIEAEKGILPESYPLIRQDRER